MSLWSTIIGWFKGKEPVQLIEPVLPVDTREMKTSAPDNRKIPKPSKDVIEEILEGASREDFLSELRSILPKKSLGATDDIRGQLKKIAKDSVPDQEHK